MRLLCCRCGRFTTELFIACRCFAASAYVTVRYPMRHFYVHIYTSVMSSSWGLCEVLASLYLSLSLSISSHFITMLSPLSNPLSIRPLLFDLPSLQPRLPLSLGFGCSEVSLSLMTVGTLSARPPLCPQLVQLSRGTEGQGSGMVSQTDPLHQNKPQKHFSAVIHSWRQTFEVQDTFFASYIFSLLAFLYSKYNHSVLQCTLCAGYVVSGVIWIRRKNNADWVIITVLRAHRSYASFNFTLYSPHQFTGCLPLPLSLTLSLSQ